MLRAIFGCVLFFLAMSHTYGAEPTPPNLIAGKQVEADAKLQVGDRLVGIYEKKNFVVKVLEIKSNKNLRILWLEDDTEADDVPQTTLYRIGESTPTRKSRASALPDAYRSLDKNGDGQIGLNEWDRAKYAEFRKLDKNHDGFLTPQELAGKGGATTPTTASGDMTKNVETKDKPAPVNLVEYNTKGDQPFTFKVTGNVAGVGVWGTGEYSTDSNLAAVAVHAGVLKNGDTGSVTVTIKARAEKFTGSMANGVTSVERNEAGPAFTIKSTP